MAGKGVKWLIGCGSAVGLLIIVTIIVGFFLLKDTIISVKNTVEDIKEIAAMHEELVDRYGEVDEFVPPADGVPTSSRIARFLSVRDGMEEERTRLQSKLAVFPPAEVMRGEDEALSKVAGVLKELGGLIPDVTEYLRLRTQLLRDLEMSPGEYLYIYSLVYYSWLGNSPSDGPYAMEIDSDGSRYQSNERLMEGDGGTFSSDEIWDRYHRYLRAQIRNQLAAATDGGGDEGWRDELRREYLMFKEDPDRIPWQNGLPAPVLEALAPYRDRLEASYSPDINCFELSPMKKDDWEDQSRKFEITSD